MKKTTIVLIQSLVGLLPLLYLAFLWNNLPLQIPLHYNSRFEVDRFGSKMELLVVLVVLYALTIGITLLLLNLNQIDPKKKFDFSSGSPSTLIGKVSWTLAVFMTAISFFVVYLCSHDASGASFTGKYLLLLIALLYTVLGNFMNNMKPNYFVGIRTPWTLESEDNWKKTHHLASRVWFFGGLLMALLIVTLPQSMSTFVILAGTVPLVLIPVYYSWSLFRRNDASLNSKQ